MDEPIVLEWSIEGEPLRVGHEPRLAKGVRGTAFDTPSGIYIPLIHAEVEGAGDVGRFLDRLPRDHRVVFPNVLSSRLAAMLRRRDFVLAVDEGMPVFERAAQ